MHPHRPHDGILTEKVMEMPSYKELVASREERRNVLREKYLESQNESIEAILNEEEDRQERTETVAKIIAFGKTLATDKMNFFHPMIFRTDKKSCKSRMGAQICQGVLLDRQGNVYLSYGPNTDLPIGSRLRRQVPQVVVPVNHDTGSTGLSLLEIRMVSKRLHDCPNIDYWDDNL